MPTLVIKSRCCSAMVRASRRSSSHARSGSYPAQGLEPLPMTLPGYTSTREDEVQLVVSAAMRPPTQQRHFTIADA